jgi:hypothetical protein
MSTEPLNRRLVTVVIAAELVSRSERGSGSATGTAAGGSLTGTDGGGAAPIVAVGTAVKTTVVGVALAASVAVEAGVFVDVAKGTGEPTVGVASWTTGVGDGDGRCALTVADDESEPEGDVPLFWAAATPVLTRASNPSRPRARRILIQTSLHRGSRWASIATMRRSNAST